MSGSACPGQAAAGSISASLRMLALACSDPPDERKGWTLRMLADKLVELEVVESVSTETVRRAMKKTSSSRT